jgi:hypothetical protein
VTGLELGAKVEAESIPSKRISYAPKDDVLIVASEGLEYLIRVAHGTFAPACGSTNGWGRSIATRRHEKLTSTNPSRN